MPKAARKTVEIKSNSTRATKTPEVKEPTTPPDPWRGFRPGLWQRDVNVRWFLQQNYRP